MFPCIQCGLCCQHLELNPAYVALDRGDGVCRHYLSEGKICEIYETRPDLCRIDESYHVFSKQMSLGEYYFANIRVCRELIGKFG